jgi:hypothetical protein
MPGHRNQFRQRAACALEFTKKMGKLYGHFGLEWGLTPT